MLTVNYMVIPRKSISWMEERRATAGMMPILGWTPSWKQRVVEVWPALRSATLRLFLCLVPSPGKLEAWRIVYLQKQIPVASILGILVSSHRNPSFPESFIPIMYLYSRIL